MKRATKLFPFVLLAAILCLSLTAQANNGNSTNYNYRTTFLVENVMDNPCTGEPVSLSGYTNFHLHIVMDSNGGSHLGNHFVSPSIDAVGLTSGIRYNVIEVMHLHENNADVTDEGFDIVPGRASEGTFRSLYKIVAPGPNNNFTAVSSYHFTVNANGDMTADRSSFGEARCQ